MITALCGGVGGSKLIDGLFRILAEDELTVIGNTADDLVYMGLRVCPDLDTVTYTLAGMAGEKGWGIADDSFDALSMLERYGAPSWFRLGDRDLATSIYRSDQLRQGVGLADVTADLLTALGVKARLVPMTEDRVGTRLLVGGDWLHFQDYFVRRAHRDRVEAVRYAAIERAAIGAGILEALTDAEAVVLVNSNPVLSILPILSVPGMRDLVASVQSPVVAVSPLIGSAAVSGPAGELMSIVGKPPTATGVAALYGDFINGIVIDQQDAEQRREIEDLGLAVMVTDTIMSDGAGRERLARAVLDFAHSLA